MISSFMLVGAVALPRMAVPPRRIRTSRTTPRLLGAVDVVGERFRKVLPFDPQMGGRGLLGVAVISLVLFFISPPLSLVPMIALLVRSSRHRRRGQIEADAAVSRALPDVIDLLTLAVGSGLTLRLAFSVSAPWFPEPFRSVAEETIFRCESGDSFVTALETASLDLGEAARPLISTLIASQTDGAALSPALERAGDEARRGRRVAAEERARRIPVAMLFPLVVCVLPAFALLTVVPLLIGTFSNLQLPS